MDAEIAGVFAAAGMVAEHRFSDSCPVRGAKKPASEPR
jgi:hypothetical protein